MTQQKKKSVWTSLPMQMLYGLIVGVIVGAMVSTDFAVTYLKPLGDLFIRLIRTVVVPLVLATLIAGAAGLGDASRVGRIAVKTLIVFAITTAIAVAFGLVFANFIDPGVGLSLSTEGLKVKHVAAPPLSQVLLNIVAINPVEAMAKGNMLQIIFFAVFFGLCLSALKEEGKPVMTFFQVMGDVMIKMTMIVMYYAPIGVFGLIAFTVARHGLAVLLPLGKLIVCAFVATACYVVVTYGAMLIMVGMKISKFASGTFSPWMIAFTTCSSAAALAVNMNSARQLGATKSIASFVIPLGNTVNMNGTALYMGVCSIFAAQVFGIELSVGQQLTIVMMGVLAAIGTAGVPGAGLIMSTIVFTQVGIPLEAIALIAGVDRILDMIRTSVNVLGDCLTAIVVSRLEGVLGSEKFTEADADKLESIE